MSVYEPDPRAACDGKEAFESALIAFNVAKRRESRGYNSKSYRCIHCGVWHIGTPLKRLGRRPMHIRRAK